MKSIALIVALDERSLIGRESALPWHLPDDLGHFKALTLGKTMLMGRKTWQSLGGPLQERENWVISRDPAFAPEGARVFADLDTALAAHADGELMVIGGGEIYRQLLPRADRIYLTQVHAQLDGDAWLPPIPAEDFVEIAREDHAADEHHAHAFSWLTLQRRPPQPVTGGDRAAARWVQDLRRNLAAGWRALWLRPLRPESFAGGAGPLAVLLVLTTLGSMGLTWLYFQPQAQFNLWALHGLGFEFLFLLGLGALAQRLGGGPLALQAPNLAALSTGLCLLPLWAVFNLVLRAKPEALSSTGYWLALAGLLLWSAAATIAAAVSAGAMRARAAAVTAAGIAALHLLAVWMPGPNWFVQAYDEPPMEEAAPRRPGIASEEMLELQPQLFDQAVAELQPQRPGIIDAYFLGFAPYADEDVFMLESRVIRQLMDERFDTAGRSLLLINNQQAMRETPIASAGNLRRALKAIGQRMDPQEDLLVLYLTSHGSRQHQLSADFWPLELTAVTPALLRGWLDESGIRYRVVAVSACYSGGYVEPLRDAGTLVMTASDAQHTSFGCGSESTFTYFGKAVFDEQLRRTYSFEQAFKAALPLLRERETAAGGKEFSNPQIAVGADIALLLQRYESDLSRKVK